MAANKEILINAFDMSTIGHLSPGQWKASTTGHAASKHKRLTTHRTLATSRLQSATWITGSTWQSYSKEATSMLCFWLTHTAATILTSKAWMSVFAAQHDGQ
jgi:hypothetical protein